MVFVKECLQRQEGRYCPTEDQKEENRSLSDYGLKTISPLNKKSKLKKILFLLIIPSLSFGQIVTEDCSSIPDPGPCFGCGFIYWFNPATSQCEESCWGLCDGLVPFWTLEDCQNSCENTTFIKEKPTNKVLLKKMDFMINISTQHNASVQYILIFIFCFFIQFIMVDV